MKKEKKFKRKTIEEEAIEQMTDEQKKVYYVTKISKVSNEEFGLFLGLVLCMIRMIPVQIIYGSFEENPILPFAAVYFMLKFLFNAYMRDVARDELAKLNQNELENNEISVEPTDIEKPKVKRK